MHVEWVSWKTELIPLSGRLFTSFVACKLNGDHLSSHWLNVSPRDRLLYSKFDIVRGTVEHSLLRLHAVRKMAEERTIHYVNSFHD